LHNLFELLFSEDIINFLLNRLQDDNRVSSDKLGYTLLRSRFCNFSAKAAEHFNVQQIHVGECGAAFVERVRSIEISLNVLRNIQKETKDLLHLHRICSFEDLLTIGSKAGYRENMIILLAIFAIESLLEIFPEEVATKLLKDMKLHWPLYNVLQRTGRGENAIERDVLLVMMMSQDKGELFSFQALDPALNETELEKLRKDLIEKKILLALQMLDEDETRDFLGLNEYRGITYFSKESYEEIIDWFFTTSVLMYFRNMDDTYTVAERKKIEFLVCENINLLTKAREVSERSGYQLHNLKELLSKMK
jgi:hypothetical protein